MNIPTKRLNETDIRVLNAMQELRVSNRSFLVRMTNLPRSTIFDALRRLEKKGLIERDGMRPNGKKTGRPNSFWRLVIPITEG